jgi:hypothetical protein
MKTSMLVAAMLALLVNCTPACAADFDGTKPIICSVIQVVVCSRDGGIEKETAEGVNLPQFFFIDIQKKTVSAKGPSGDSRQSTIETVRHENGMLILEGVQLGKAWHAVINEQTGKTTLTGTTDETAFVVFAACTLTQGSDL